MSIKHPILTDENSTAATTAGTVYEDLKTGKKYRYVKAGAAITLSAACKFSGDPETVIMTTNLHENVAGIANSAITSGDYFWLKTHGRTMVIAAASTATLTLVTTATDGDLADSAATDKGNLRVICLVGTVGGY